MSDFTHLHVHSHYSLLDGLGQIRPMLERARDLGMNSLALTDHGSMYGAVEFIRAAGDYGVKPIAGLETYLAPNGHKRKRAGTDSQPRHLTLLAQNMAGYKNLIKLTTKAHLEGFYYKPRIDYDLLKEHSEGLIVLSGCLNSDLSKAIVERRPQDAEKIIKWHLEVFGKNRYYLEVQEHPHLDEQKIVNQALIDYGQKFGIGLAATADSHYLAPEDNHVHDVLLCVQTGKDVGMTDRMSMLDDDFSLKSPTEMKELWKGNPEAIDNTQKIADSCSIELEFGVNRLPPFPLPPGKTADQHLRNECMKGMKQRYGKITEEAQERLDYELKVIGKTGYASYFLIVADFVNEAKNRGILVGPGRGSAAGSLVSYVMRITDLDPLAYNLLFERFLNPERVSMPDIDLDFADDRRDEIIQYVREKYGSDHVAQIITFGTMAPRASVRDAGRALGMPYAFCDQVAKAIPMFNNFKEALETPDLKAMYNSDPQAKKLIDVAKHLEGVARHASTHAAGVVITDEPLTEYVPLQVSSTGSDKDAQPEIVTQYAMNDVEALGLLKIDFLGLKNLTIIKNTLNRIKETHDVDVDIEKLPLDDPKAYQLLQEGKSTGVFQLESAGMKRYLKELQPTELEDIISMVSLYRPGPMDSIPDFIAAKQGRKRITYLHPILKPILEKTYGVIVTQDQVLQIAREFAGFSYAEADILRKAVGKKIKKLLDEQRQKFIKGAIATNDIDRKLATKVWDFIEPFARYGFNRAHGACYAMIAYQTAYLKAHYPAEFMAALLTADEGNLDRASIEIAECISMGLEILPPDINESGNHFTVVDAGRGIRFGLSAIKNVGHGAVAAVISEREENGRFSDIADVFARVHARDFNKKSVESLAQVGAFDSLAERAEILANMERLLAFNKSLQQQTETGQQGLFSDDSKPAARIDLEKTTAASREQRLSWEKELLGIYVSEHPLTIHKDVIEKMAKPLAEIGVPPIGSEVQVAGLITRTKQIVTKKGQAMMFVEIEDQSTNAEVVVFPSVFASTKSKWQDGATVLIKGKTNERDGEIKILADSVKPLASLSAAARLTIKLPPSFSAADVKKLQATLAQHNTPEGQPVDLLIPHQGELKRVSTEYKLKSLAGVWQ